MARFRPKPMRDRQATQEELDCIEKTEKMLEEENKLPPASQMIRNLAVDHWKSLKAWVKGSQVITSQEEGGKFVKLVLNFFMMKLIQIQVKKMVGVHCVVVL